MWANVAVHALGRLTVTLHGGECQVHHGRGEKRVRGLLHPLVRLHGVPALRALLLLEARHDEREEVVHGGRVTALRALPVEVLCLRRGVCGVSGAWLCHRASG